MDQESIVYGCIKDHTLTTDEQRRMTNESVVAELPSVEDWPFICREMFAQPVPSTDIDASLQTDVTHFGASYKAIEYEWDQWIEQFEQLLSKMYWSSATVHLETELSGRHSFVWHADGDCYIPGESNMHIRCEWTREDNII